MANDEKTIQFSIELWHIMNLLDKMCSKFDLDEQRKFSSQIKWFKKKTEDYLKGIGLSFADFQPSMAFDAGMPINPLNIGDFKSEDELFIEQVLEPAILCGGQVVKQGTVILKKGQL